MARRRGFFAELQYQQQLAERRRAQEARAYARAHAAAVREAELAQRQADRAAAAAARAATSRQKAAVREAKRLHEEARAAEAEALNAMLAGINDELDSILVATLDVDDHVDLERFRVHVEHPPFPRGDLEFAAPEIVPIAPPPEPLFEEPEAPTGLGSLFGGKKRHAAAVAEARRAFDEKHSAWQAEVAAIPDRELELRRRRDASEEQRMRALQTARDTYALECQTREAEAAASNEQLDALIAGLAAGEHAAVQEYVGIVLSNSVYPEILSVEHDYDFDAETRELSLVVLISPPDVLPTEKVYRYVRAKDEISSTAAPKKDLKERYAGIVDQVALRTLHEVFEADRAGKIRTITLQVATETIDPATGRDCRIAFAAVAAERDSFMTFDLSNVVPAATLQHLGAATSKNPYELMAVDGAPGVRSR